MADEKINPVSHFPAADGIRGLAVMIVLIVHGLVMFYPETYKGLAGSGKIGVWLFFVLSSFLLTNIFIIKGMDCKSISSYFVGRIIRIIPLYATTLLIYSLFGYFSFEDAITIFKLNAPWGHLWTIAVEFKFYFILPIIAFVLIKLKDRPLLVVLAALLIMTAQLLIIPYYQVKPSSTDVAGYISCFIPGMVAAVIVSSGAKNSRTISDVAMFLIALSMIISIPCVRLAVTGIAEDGYLLDKHVHFSLAWSIFIYLALTSCGVINKFLSSRALRAIGKWSFSIYLFHWLVYTQISPSHQHSIIASFSSLILSIIVGALVFYFFERPIEKLRHQIMKRFLR